MLRSSPRSLRQPFLKIAARTQASNSLQKATEWPQIDLNRHQKQPYKSQIWVLGLFLASRVGKHIIVADHQVSGAHILAREHNIKNQILTLRNAKKIFAYTLLISVCTTSQKFLFALSQDSMTWELIPKDEVIFSRYQETFGPVYAKKKWRLPGKVGLRKCKNRCFCLYSFEDNSKFKANLVFALTQPIFNIF